MGRQKKFTRQNIPPAARENHPERVDYDPSDIDTATDCYPTVCFRRAKHQNVNAATTYPETQKLFADLTNIVGANLPVAVPCQGRPRRTAASRPWLNPLYATAGNPCHNFNVSGIPLSYYLGQPSLLSIDTVREPCFAMTAPPQQHAWKSLLACTSRESW